MYEFLTTTGQLTFLTALVVVPWCYVAYRSAPPPKRALPLAGFIAGTLGAAVAGYFVGTALGIGIACGIFSAGNLCGLFGIFGSGPIVAAAAMMYYAYTRAGRARQRP